MCSDKGGLAFLYVLKDPHGADGAYGTSIPHSPGVKGAEGGMERPVSVEAGPRC